ncbi:MAG: porphobilinogen synthase [Actinomycetaceae bacterium]|nr:porphobilinogen synthase [Actinomycetaceae bacterium]
METVSTSPILDSAVKPYVRPRRLRATPALRELVRENRWSTRQLVLPIFVREGISEPAPIASLPGQFQHTVTSAVALTREAVDAGVGGVIIFGVPAEENKDEFGSNAWSADCIANKALRAIRDEVGERIVLMADTCLDEFTSHGHCGPLTPQGDVDNDAAVACYQKVAVSQAEAGAQIVAPSGMMDGQVAAIRAALDEAGFDDVAILAYSAKFASAFYGPFRDAVGCELSGDRKSYQEDPANRREALHETELDIAEGADMVMVKPGSSYLDILSDVAEILPVPVGVYQVSGEYAMVAAAAERGWIDLERIVDEQLTSFVRAGADFILTYWALTAAKWC